MEISKEARKMWWEYKRASDNARWFSLLERVYHQAFISLLAEDTDRAIERESLSN